MELKLGDDDIYTDKDEIQRIGVVIDISLSNQSNQNEQLGLFIFRSLSRLSQDPNANMNNFHFEAKFQGKKIRIEKIRKSRTSL